MLSTSKTIILTATITIASMLFASKVSAFLHHHSHMQHRCGRFSSSLATDTRRRIWNPLGSSSSSSSNNNVDVYKQEFNSNSQTINKNAMFEGLLSSALNRAQSTLEQTREFSSTSSSTSSSFSTPTAFDQQPPTQEQPKKENSKKTSKGSYRDNPAITNTALAHSLWREILKPNQDSAIDATCGNGHDTLAMAEILFPSADHEDNNKHENYSQLLALDIQERACQSTTKAIRERFGPSILEEDHRVEVRQTSHAPLPTPSDGGDVGLIVYNLGWLPNANHNNNNNNNNNKNGKKAATTTSSSNKDCITKVESTLQSLTDAALMIRIGGMISVTTYPATNEEEDLAVRVLLECLALLSSNVQTWRGFLDEIYDDTVVHDDDDDESDDEKLQPSKSQLSKETMEMIVVAMERIVSEGEAKQTFRVSEHRKLGMYRAPILLTATRIK
ncbi:unnamed protein product [Cylindrotheca closterium]|uniref:rRNA methylase n=1 Tax=Cylindrotheca closterium TaxID=2856 RepID=A0AAD2FUI2_9STRA|nr:unnamed protein product [Cylindrotheca closterium]